MQERLFLPTVALIQSNHLLVYESQFDHGVILYYYGMVVSNSLTK